MKDIWNVPTNTWNIWTQRFDNEDVAFAVELDAQEIEQDLARTVHKL